MGFSEKINAYFKGKGLKKREVCKIMDNYSESMLSQFMKSDKISGTFIMKLVKYFPDIDLNELLKDDVATSEVVIKKDAFKEENIDLIEEIKEKLLQLQTNIKKS